MAAILEICFALFLLNRKANLSGNQVSDTGPVWPSCIVNEKQNEITSYVMHIGKKSLVSVWLRTFLYEFLYRSSVILK